MKHWSTHARGVVLLLAVACKAPPPHRAPPPDSAAAVSGDDSSAASAARFAQAFYDWYRRHDDRLEAAVSQRPEVFSAELLAALRRDIGAQAKSPDDVVGLDWDPFTGSQDPCDPYRVDRVTRRGDTVLVAMRGTCKDAAPRQTPDAIAALRQAPAGWQFVDVLHGDGSGTLLRDLAELRAERDR